ncbi:MAG: S41 family peptidase, partial [Shewanella sp.]
ARMDQGKVVFQLGADIHIFDIASAKDSLLNIELISDFAQRREHWVTDPMDYATSANLAPAGDKVVITARSHVAIAGIDGSRLVQVALPGTYRVRNAILSQDGKSVYAISDMTGQQEIWQFPADGTRGAKQLTKDGNTLRMSLSLSNDGRYLAHDDNDGNVWLLDLKKNTNQKIISHGEGLGPYVDIRWSGDSRFIALTKSEIGKQRPQIVLYSVDENKAQALTSDKYESYSPTFSRDGQWLYFLSNRQFTATPSSPWGDRNMGPVFDKRSQIFAISLVKNAKFPFSKPTELTAKTAAKAEAKDKPIPVKIDWAGIRERLWQVPVDSGNYSQLSAIDDRLYVLDQAIGDESQPNLMTIKFTEQQPKAEVFAEDVANYGVSADGKKLLLRKKSNEKSLLIVDAGDKLGDTDNAKVQTEQWQLAISPTLEWQQMFEDAWLMHRDSFFDKNMRGLDWQATKAKYQPMLERLTDRNELNDIFMQMMGELDSLHSQVRGGDLPKDPDAAKGASLGARLQHTRDGVKIAHIYRNDPELPSQASPLSRIEVDAKEGDLLLAINGTPVTNVADVTRLLRNQQDKQVLLELKRADQRHKTVVIPVSTLVDSQLRYLDWVNHNASVVTEASQGKIGYLHLYAMGGGDIESFAREFYTNYDKDGLIIDVRRNRGGNIDSW